MTAVRDLGWSTTTGAALLLAGLAGLAVGLVQLRDPVVESAYFDRAVGASSEAVTVTFVEGRGWVVAGTLLVAVGAAMLLAAALRLRR